MMLQILLLLVGLALVVFGADYLVDGASAIARRVGLSEFVIGLTIVGMGTSAPEMVVSFIGAFQGNADISVGNVVGSNIFNTLLILGITGILLPMAITPENRKQDIPINILVTIALILLGFKHTIFGIGTDGLDRIDGAILLLMFIAYMWRSFATGKGAEEVADDAKPLKLGWAIVMIVGGIAALIFGGKLFVNSATHIAHSAGISDKFIAITLLAGGTSMPELATCIAAAVKKRASWPWAISSAPICSTSFSSWEDRPLFIPSPLPAFPLWTWVCCWSVPWCSGPAAWWAKRTRWTGWTVY